jgi:hypothetical protein
MRALAKCQAAPKNLTHKVKFTQAEDFALTELVKKYGEADWSQIAAQMQGRNVRQCRDRWSNYLSPNVANGPWTQEENSLLIDKVQALGPRWTKISPFFPGRTEINIRNHWMIVSRSVPAAEAITFATKAEPLVEPTWIVQSPTEVDHEKLLQPEHVPLMWEPTMMVWSADPFRLELMP